MKTTNDNAKQTITLDEINDLIDSFELKRIECDRNCGGRWVMGTMGGHKFDALVFAEHAECESYELGQSRISKLSIQRIGDKKTVACFDRGWDTQPTTRIAERIVDPLAECLADAVFE